jgi:CBS domain-containing protein
MRHTIMTEKIARRGVHIPGGYTADFLESLRAVDLASKPAFCLAAKDTVAKTREWLESEDRNAGHQGYPVLDENGDLLGVLTRRDLLARSADRHASLASLVRRTPVTIGDGASAREAVHLMAREGVGRLPVVSSSRPRRVIGILTRRDILNAYHRDEELGQAEISLRILPR